MSEQSSTSMPRMINDVEAEMAAGAHDDLEWSLYSWGEAPDRDFMQTEKVTHRDWGKFDLLLQEAAGHTKFDK
jgi:hypothetical protein